MPVKAENEVYEVWEMNVSVSNNFVLCSPSLMLVSGFEVENIVLCVKKCMKWSWQNVRVDHKPHEKNLFTETFLIIIAILMRMDMGKMVFK